MQVTKCLNIFLNVDNIKLEFYIPNKLLLSTDYYFILKLDLYVYLNQSNPKFVEIKQNSNDIEILLSVFTD